MFDIGNKHYEFFDMLNQHAKYFNQGSKIMYDGFCCKVLNLLSNKVE